VFSKKLWGLSPRQGPHSRNYACEQVAHHYDRWLDEADDLLHRRTSNSGHDSPTKSSHLEIGNGEDGAEYTANKTEYQRWHEHNHVDRNGATEL